MRVKMRGYREDLLSGSFLWRTHRSAPCYAWDNFLRYSLQRRLHDGTAQL